MTENNNIPVTESEIEHFPIEPRYHPVNRIARKIYDFLASSKLAMALLIAILISCVAGVTIFRQQRAWEVIFSTVWFNGLLVLLVVNVACCFFGRVWHRKLTVISFGMILFHLSFVAMFCAIVYNSLFYFEGSMRLTEGEVLPNADPLSYDSVRQGRFFSYSRLRGETSLIKMHRGYRVAGEDKRAAYEIGVGEGSRKKKGIIYLTHNLDYRGFTYFPDKEGYSLLVALIDKNGKDLYGAHVPLQSLKKSEKDSYLYTTGTKDGPGSFPYPQEPLKPHLALQLAYLPSALKERGGDVMYQAWPLRASTMQPDKDKVAEGKAAVGEIFTVGEDQLSVREVRYWVGMTVRYEPGKPIVLASLWVGFAGMVITTIGRMTRRRGERKTV